VIFEELSYLKNADIVKVTILMARENCFEKDSGTRYVNEEK
jgi:hypothetical protein